MQWFSWLLDKFAALIFMNRLNMSIPCIHTEQSSFCIIDSMIHLCIWLIYWDRLMVLSIWLPGLCVDTLQINTKMQQSSSYIPDWARHLPPCVISLSPILKREFNLVKNNEKKQEYWSIKKMWKETEILLASIQLRWNDWHIPRGCD